MFSLNVCYQKLLEIVHREEEKVNWILSAKVVFLNSEKGPRDRYKLPAIRHFTPFKKDAINGAGTERTWYLIWKAADRRLLTQNAAVQVVTVSLQVVSYHIKYINNFVSKVTSRKNQISQKRYRLSNRLLQCPFPRRSNLLVAWVSHDFPFRRACLNTTSCRAVFMKVAGLTLWTSGKASCRKAVKS